MPSTIKVLVVDDSALIRQMLVGALRLDPRMEIVGVARTGVEAIEKARDLAPDVITLDIEMPDLTGLEALPHLLKATQARIVMLSSIDDPDTTYQALSAGAVDFIPKPRAGVATSLTELSEDLIKKIKIAYRIDPAKRLAVGGEVAPRVRSAGARRAARTLRRIVAVAASTGGPPALERMFSGLDSGLPATYLIVQHLPPGFTASLARRLSKVTDIEVTEAADGMSFEPAHAFLAPHGMHMRVAEFGGEPRISLEDGPSQHGVKPAADPLFFSIAERFGRRGVGVVLSGMGADGAAGLESIMRAGGVTIAQDEETSVVWGMPGAAVRSGAARRVVPVGLVAAEVRRAIRGGGGA
ncbi:MAG: chemotaxis-specific protein-glutamate methyltransferase CheB [Coriobacteriia bacterium]